MPTRAQESALRLRLAARRFLPRRTVTRTIQGVSMVMPSDHALDLFTAYDGPYGKNLVDLARLLGDSTDRFVFLDIGANIGDSTLQVLDAAPGEAVCVEPDPTWLPYLDANVGNSANVEIERSALIPPDSTMSVAVAERNHGTTRLGSAEGKDALPTISTDQLLAAHSVLQHVKLVKTDTDGYDVGLLPSLARTFSATRPVLFFEYDQALTRLAQPDVSFEAMWADLRAQGYTRGLAWTNGGIPLHHGLTEDLAVAAAELDQPAEVRGYHYWDVALAHADDEAGQSALEELWNRRARG